MDAAESLSHLNALQLRLSNERVRMSEAKTDGERKLRGAWIAQIEKEIADCLGTVPDMSDDELLNFLMN